MFYALCLSLSLLAPIPKNKTYEGQIAVMITSPKPAVVIISPDGKEVNRFSLDEIGRPTAIKNTRNSDAVLITAFGNNAGGNNVVIGGPGGGIMRVGAGLDGYLVKLDGKTKPKKLLENYASIRWVVNSDVSKIYGVGLSAGKAFNENETSAFEIDVATAKVKDFTIAGSVDALDLAADNDTILMQDSSGDSGVSLFSMKTKKLTPVEGVSINPYGISPDGKKLFGYITEAANNAVPQPVMTSQLGIADIERKSNVKITLPEGMRSANYFTCGADNQRVAFAGVVQKQIEGKLVQVYYLCTAKMDGTDAKKIYETKPGEVLGDIDWR